MGHRCVWPPEIRREQVSVDAQKNRGSVKKKKNISSMKQEVENPLTFHPKSWKWQLCSLETPAGQEDTFIFLLKHFIFLILKFFFLLTDTYTHIYIYFFFFKLLLLLSPHDQPIQGGAFPYPTMAGIGSSIPVIPNGRITNKNFILQLMKVYLLWRYLCLIWQ